jgi:hypothetical protein
VSERAYFYPVPRYGDDGQIVAFDLCEEKTFARVGTLAGVVRDEWSVEDGYLTARIRLHPPTRIVRALTGEPPK